MLSTAISQTSSTPPITPYYTRIMPMAIGVIVGLGIILLAYAATMGAFNTAIASCTVLSLVSVAVGSTILLRLPKPETCPSNTIKRVNHAASQTAMVVKSNLTPNSCTFYANPFNAEDLQTTILVEIANLPRDPVGFSNRKEVLNRTCFAYAHQFHGRPVTVELIRLSSSTTSSPPISSDILRVTYCPGSYTYKSPNAYYLSFGSNNCARSCFKSYSLFVQVPLVAMAAFFGGHNTKQANPLFPKFEEQLVTLLPGCKRSYTIRQQRTSFGTAESVVESTDSPTTFTLAEIALPSTLHDPTTKSLCLLDMLKLYEMLVTFFDYVKKQEGDDLVIYADDLYQYADTDLNLDTCARIKVILLAAKIVGVPIALSGITQTDRNKINLLNTTLQKVNTINSEKSFFETWMALFNHSLTREALSQLFS